MNLVGGISLVTAFAGGMVALFAPCCITFLLPSYLANIFREKGRVLWMTLLFGVGIATILVPTALGIRAIGKLFEQYHTQAYVVGGAFMVLLGLMELTGRKITLPMINLTIDLNRRHDAWSVYLLGIFSGITSSCCTPVLAGVLTISFLAPSMLWAGLAGVSYVFGMVLPLVILALFLEKVNWERLPMLRKKTVSIGDKQILLSDAVAGVLYIAIGILFATLATTGQITMGMPTSIEMALGENVAKIVRAIQAIPLIEVIVAILVISTLVVLFNKVRRSK